MPNLTLDSPLQFVKGIGPKKAEVLAGQGLVSVRDLLEYFPRRYLDRTNVTSINRLRIGESVTIVGEVKAHGILYGKKPRYEVILQDDTAAIALVWFGGVRHWQHYFQKGQVFAASGTISYFMNMQMVHPDLERLDSQDDTMIHGGRIIPVYPQTSELSKVGLTSKNLRQLTDFTFEHLDGQIPDVLPAKEREQLELMSLHEAIRQIHYPESREEIERARRRLAFDELLALQYYVFRNKLTKQVADKAHSYAEPGEKLKQLTAMLPYPLTEGQKRTTREIIQDLRDRHPMSRMLQGEVGCGKTVVAVMAGTYAAENGLQCAFMAPTEILAEQHFRNWHDLLAQIGVKSALLTSSLSAAQKRQVAKLSSEGQVDLVFGTHALIYDYIEFAKLGLVIIDEQHRFGVEQRGALHAKGDNPDLLVMTATPIPRTLALTLYGDLDISTIRELPPGRKPTRTVWRGGDVRAKVYDYVCSEVKKGGQAYVIFPLIEKSEMVEHLLSVEDAYEELTAGPFKTCSVAMVHGRIKPKERDEILAKFRAGEIEILLATTVIEVGIDNPNATMLVIEHAERFGLAQLHQLRGRVGRGSKAATVVALAHPPISEQARQRLEFFANSVDGFAIAEADLSLRGPGELFGLRQSGLPELRVAHLGQDQDLLEGARALLERLFANHNNLDTADRELYSYLQQTASRRDVLLGGG